jgi:ATP-dependent Clp protease ATP-binding subunit ClpA
MQKAFLEDGTMPEKAGHTIVVGTTTEADYAERIASVSAVAEHAHVLRVPPSTLDETVEILKTARSRFESDYKLKVESDALQVAASLAGRYFRRRLFVAPA